MNNIELNPIQQYFDKLIKSLRNQKLSPYVYERIFGRSCERHRELLQDLFNQGDKQCESCLLEYYGEDT